ncbi:MAG TPA: sensor histidine kinase [Myxococcaceae bacterium]|nr:sensor histidine kinase [Myxococcaceae bacterium]
MAGPKHLTAAGPRPPATGSEAEQRLGRSVLIGLAVLGVIALVGPFLTYLNEVRETQRLLRTRVAREAAVYAEALALHFGTLEHELERLASRPQVDLLDENLQPERELLEFTHHNSPFFSAVLFLDGNGVPVWSEPRGALPALSRGRDRWFQRMLRTDRPVVDALEEGSRSFVVAAPILRDGRVSGAVLGLVDASKRGLPGGRATTDGSTLVVSTDHGEVLLPATPPAWTFAAGFPGRVDELMRRGRAETTELSGTPEYAAATQVGNTGLRLLLVAEESPMLAPVRWRFFWQMLLVLVGQTVTILLFSWFLRRTYLRYREIDEVLAQQEKLAALGGAASLIAHEVKNSLNGMKVAASMLSRDGDRTLPVKTMRGQIDRLSHLATSLLNFGKPTSAQLSLIPVGQLVSEAVESLRVLPEADEVEVTSELDTSLRVPCDPLLLATALDNLLRNAMEAAVVAKDLGKQAHPRVRITARRVDGVVRVEVEDNAGGPPPGFEAGLFQPFVTTKPRGIGLGLSMARQAVERQGGSLAFERTATGSRFTVQLGLGTTPS